MLKTKSKKGKPYKPATVNRFVTLMKRVYNLAIRDDMVEKSPCWKVAFLPERNARSRIATAEEFEMLKRELPQYSLVLTIKLLPRDETGGDLETPGKANPFPW